jgi:hypothetical protein
MFPNFEMHCLYQIWPVLIFNDLLHEKQPMEPSTGLAAPNRLPEKLASLFSSNEATVRLLTISDDKSPSGYYQHDCVSSYIIQIKRK